MHRFDDPTVNFLPGQPVRIRVLSHEPWGLMAEIIGDEDVGCSVDMIAGGSVTGSGPSRREEFPPVGAEVDAVVQQVWRWRTDPPWIRLSIRRPDLDSFQWPCEYCLQPTTLSPGGDGVVIDVRSNDSSRVVQLTAHRACFSGHLHPESTERTRADILGQ
ncbi:hypothetical protein [Nonomuraea zeae]|uniref:Uncharacterized protein n=1 Tax=Nonomuraea zeae TaxID=1642303 RepID=A0A5S4FER5_9ACTN|nr:hypothetical protein [Nonomuraea zeae]TMR17388.1 hypothetical protein ETD85_54385 [Nonomuraea zeae]